jgi:predicted dehydrogenase
MRQLGIGLIGCGAIASVHLQAIISLPNARLAAVADVDDGKAREYGKRFGCAFYTNYEDLLARDDIDIVHICTGHYLHAPMAIQALQAGKHVLTEKPMAENKEAALSMLEAEGAHPSLQLGVIFQNRYNPASAIMKQYADSGELGQLVGMKGMVTWHRDSEYYTTEWKGRWATEGGGVLINQAIHTLDLLQWLGGKVVSLKGSMSNDSLEGIIEVEDTVHAHLVFASGATAILYATNAYRTNSPVEMELLFEQGKLMLQGERLTLEHDGQQSLLCDAPVNEQGEKSYWGISHRTQIADFYHHIQAGKPYWLNGREGYKAFELVMDTYESARSGKRIVYE